MPTPTPPTTRATPTTRAAQASGQYAHAVQSGPSPRGPQPQPQPLTRRRPTTTQAPTPLRAHAPALCTGAQLRELRLARGLTRREIAGRLGYAATTIKAWELGRRAVPAHLAPLLYEVLDQVTAHLASERERFLGVLRAAWVG